MNELKILNVPNFKIMKSYSVGRNGNRYYVKAQKRGDRYTYAVYLRKKSTLEVIIAVGESFSRDVVPCNFKLSMLEPNGEPVFANIPCEHKLFKEISSAVNLYQIDVAEAYLEGGRKRRKNSCTGKTNLVIAI